MIQRSEKGYVTGCDCATYAARCKAYRMPRPCVHMLAAMRDRDAEDAPQRDPNRVRVDEAPYYAASYDVVRDGVRFVGDVDERGAVRITAVEHPGEAADYPLNAVTDCALRAAAEALAEQARSLAARGSVDTLSLPSVWTWRESARVAITHAAGPNDRRAQRELEDLERGAVERGIAIAARCAGKVAT